MHKAKEKIWFKSFFLVAVILAQKTFSIINILIIIFRSQYTSRYVKCREKKSLYKKKNTSINCLYQWWHFVSTCTIISIILKKKIHFEQKLKSIENNLHISNKFSLNNKTHNFLDYPKIGNFQTFLVKIE